MRDEDKAVLLSNILILKSKEIATLLDHSSSFETDAYEKYVDDL